MALGDLGGDGDLDLVTGNLGQVNWLYLNNGTADPFDGVSGLSIGGDIRDIQSTSSVALGHLGWDMGETDDAYNNNLARHFGGRFNRLDYVYLKQGGGTSLVPTRADVIRDWTYHDGSYPYMDLSDHYPLIATFRLVPVPSNVYLPVVLRSY